MRGLTAEENKDLIRSVGTHRGERLLSPVEVAQLLQRAISAGSTRQELSEELGIKSSQLASFLRLLDLSPDVRHIADWGRTGHAGVAFSSMAEISRLPKDLHQPATQAALTHGLTWKEVVQLVQVVDRRSEPFSLSLDSILELRPKIVRQYLVIGRLPPYIQDAVSRMPQHERDALLDTCIGTLIGGDGKVSGRLGTESFHLMAGFDLLGVLGLSADELEAQLGECMMTRIAAR